MKFTKTKNSKILEGDLTPMIDMTFQLIAFFMLLINFAEVDRAEDINLPSSVLAIPPETRPDYQIILNIGTDGTVIFEGQPIKLMTALTPIFTQEINSASREGVRNPEDIAVIIRSDADTPTGLVQDLIGLCQESQLQSFKLRVKEQVN
ncbi:MAG: biopolymer transporter ExbD [Planctomycetota bacterium]